MDNGPTSMTDCSSNETVCLTQQNGQAPKQPDRARNVDQRARRIPANVLAMGPSLPMGPSQSIGAQTNRPFSTSENVRSPLAAKKPTRSCPTITNTTIQPVTPLPDSPIGTSGCLFGEIDRFAKASTWCGHALCSLYQNTSYNWRREIKWEVIQAIERARSEQQEQHACLLAEIQRLRTELDAAHSHICSLQPYQQELTAEEAGRAYDDVVNGVSFWVTGFLAPILDNAEHRPFIDRRRRAHGQKLRDAVQ
ncbi:hypothetical protein QBC34DRAFT_474839 [Podospora aff. communis PSN243]|uniref:Uncharacterized protein n=1 Tax=Podospora aff. communis PSN243 TaxID=3040156 RepID=A0AAV9G9B5_9PEZI|nr:hypothetical protein QBC34DRAFT_474839 [Podospora aff. communis PSN243]